MANTVILSEDFFCALGKLSTEHQKIVLKKLQILRFNPFYPSLRTKKLRGDQDERFESSVNMDIRLIWRFDGDRIILVLDVGHHDVLRRY